MTAPRTRSQVGRASRAKGNRFEVAVANAVRPWLPDVRRSRDNGSANASDTGDLAGTPGIYWSLKDVAAAANEPPALIEGWLVEATKKGDGALPLLVIKRRGSVDPLRAHCWMWLDHLAHLLGADVPPETDAAVRMELEHVLDLLAAAGYARRPNLGGE